jgi:hypothetical protein
VTRRLEIGSALLASIIALTLLAGCTSKPDAAAVYTFVHCARYFVAADRIDLTEIRTEAKALSRRQVLAESRDVYEAALRVAGALIPIGGKGRPALQPNGQINVLPVGTEFGDLQKA